MTKRERLLEAIRIAAYEQDDRTAVRIYVENRISRKAYQEAYDKGKAQRGNGE